MTAKTQTKTKTDSPELKLQEQFSVDTFVENSIDELFQDVETVLEGGTRLPTESVKPEFLSLKPIKVPQIVLPQRIPTSEELIKQREEEAKAAALAQLKSKQESQSAEKILLGAAFASLVISLSLLLATKGGIEGVVGYFNPTTPEVEAPDPKVEADAKFADYIERSLDVLDKQTKTTGNNSPSTMPAVPIPPPPSELPKVPVNGAPSPNLSSLLLPLNRIADLIEAQAARPPVTIPPTQVVVIPPSPQPVPVVVNYNPPPAPAPAPAPAPVAQAQPQPAPAPVAKAQPQPAPAPVAKAQPQQAPAPVIKVENPPTTKPAEAAEAAEAKAETPPATKPAEAAEVAEAKAETPPETKPAEVAEAKAETQPVAQKAEQPAPQPRLDPLPPPPPVLVSETVALRTIPNYTHTLVGVLELGARSAALFEINGVARRIYVGESVGASGWMLVEIAEGEATMRRNGEIRSVFVGEQF